jgi:hypothetical protein
MKVMRCCLAILKRLCSTVGDSAQSRRRYALDQLLADCDPNVSLSEEDREWLASSAVGKELV